MVLQELDVLVLCLDFLLGLVQQGQQLGHSHLLIYLRTVLYLLRGNPKPQGRNGLCHVVWMRRTGHDQTSLRIPSQ